MPTPDQRAAESLRPEKILPRADYKLADNLDASRGVVFLTGIQALVRLPLMQARLDALPEVLFETAEPAGGASSASAQSRDAARVVRTSPGPA